MISIPQIPGYQVETLIYSGTETLVYRGIRAGDRTNVIIKILRDNFANWSQRVQFCNQYTIASQLNSSHTVKPIALERYNNGYALIIPDEGATMLSEYWRKRWSNRWSQSVLSDFLAIAIQLADALHDLGKQRVIHKDIKPSNIIIQAETGHVQLIDFSLSSLLPKEQQQLVNLTALEGTLAYLSPEQTGRMNRSLDYRTDFYSLGVSFFELLTGQLPFVESEALALVHAHLAKKPTAPCEINPKIPKVLSDIVLKLMAKNAEDRYQSARGLKHDLTRCLDQDGTIAPFELGARDRCDRFLIPEKLYGRQPEVSELLQAFERVSTGSTELVLVTGFSGIGKTAVINEVHKPITRQHGYFIQGKFDQLNRNRPFSAFLQAFDHLIEQLLSESDAKLALWRTRILAAVGNNGQILIDVLPSLVRILGPQLPVVKLSGTAAQNRFNLLLSQFVRVFATAAHPLVIFLDDLQWVDAASLRLLKLLIEASSSEYLLILGAYRNNEVSSTHPLMLTLADLPAEQTQLTTTLTLTPLGEDTITQLVADTLICPVATAAPLAQQIYQKTNGNPFFTTQFLQGLHQDGWITFEADSGYWQCDLATVQQLALTDDVVDFMTTRLQKLPTATRSALMTAACIGNQFDLATLAIVCQKPQTEIASDLWQGLQEGFVLPESNIYKFFQGKFFGKFSQENNRAGTQREGTQINEGLVGYRFLHDRVQQAAYSLIPADQKQAMHWQIGQRLLKSTLLQDNGEIDEAIATTITGRSLFEIVDQLNAGSHAATTEADLATLPKKDRTQLIKLNEIAGQQAKASTAYTAALAYFHTANRLLPANSWTADYALTLNIKCETIEAAYLNLELASVTPLIEEVLSTAHSLLDKIKVYELQIQAAIGNNQLIEAVDQGFEVLEQLGVPLLDPETVTITLPPLEQLDTVPKMSDPAKIAALRILVSMFSAIYNGKPELLKPTIWTMVHLCTTAGHTSVSPVAYSVYGMSMCGSGNIEEGYQSGRIALRLTEIPSGQAMGAQAMRAKVLEQVGGFISHWKEHTKISIQQFEQGLQSGLEVGDIEYACHAAKNACAHWVLLGTPLDQVQRKQLHYIELGQQLNQQHILTYAKIWRQLALSLLGQSGTPWALVGESFDAQTMLPILKEKNNYFSLYVIYFSKQMLCYLFGQLDQAIENTRILESYSKASLGSLMSVVQNFYTSLILLAEYRRQHPVQPQTLTQKSLLTDSPAPKAPLPEQVEINQDNMEQWAAYAPMNHSHKYLLVEAEKHYALGIYAVAIDLYDQAIAAAKANEYSQEEALANELAAKFWLNWGKSKVAAGYLQEAYFSYARWGAKAKTDALERDYPQLLAPILQTGPQPVSFIETLSTIDPLTMPATASTVEINSAVSPMTHPTATLDTPLTSYDAAQVSHRTNRGLNTSLDLATVLKASRAISQTVHLDDLIHQLTTIILQSSGGDRCALILPDSKEVWQLQAIATLDSTTLCCEALTDHDQLPVKLIQYVKNTQQQVVLSQLDTDLPIIDDYLQKHQPQSILCLPLLSQGALIGILYLHNLSTSNVFTEDRLSILNFLCTEAATSLEKANLYQALADYSSVLEHKVKARTQDLEQEVRDRKKAQAAAEAASKVKSEFLANMSHELRSPLNAILGFAHVMQHSAALPKEHLNDVNIISQSGEHLLSLINDVLDMSKIEAGQTTINLSDFDLHTLLDNLHNLFQLKATEKSLRYEVCYPEHLPRYLHADGGKLRQILTNLLSNAFKFTTAGHVVLRAGVGTINPDSTDTDNTHTHQQSQPHITLTFEIEDSGPGIAADEIHTLFEPFVQTATGRAVAQGTGLGLSISRKFAQLMGGNVDIISPAAHQTGTLAKVHIQATYSEAQPRQSPAPAPSKGTANHEQATQLTPETASQAASSNVPPLRELSLSHLSPELLQALASATATFQWDKIVTIIDNIRQQDDVAAEALNHVLQQFQYTQILEAIQATQALAQSPMSEKQQ